MTAAEPHLSVDEIARRGSEVFDCLVRPLLREEDNGKFIALDINTGDFELNDDDYSAIMALRSRHPSAEAWLTRVGQPAAYLMRLGR